MDYSKKPERKNPRKGANGLSQFFFAWVMPTLLRVSLSVGDDNEWTQTVIVRK